MRLPTLYKLTSTGAIQSWEISVDPMGHGSVSSIETIFGQVGGSRQSSREVVYEGKNIGKANETDAYEQACSQAESSWLGKKKKGYVEAIDDARAGTVDKTVILGGISPMLAHKYADQSSKIKFPAFVQPKLDGHRCIAVIEGGVCTLWSRTQKPILGVPHIQRYLEYVFSDVQEERVVLDGELYNHDYRDKFEELTSFIRQTTPKPGHEVVQYWVYDVILEGQPFSQRSLWLIEDEDGWEDPVIPVETSPCDSPEALIQYFQEYRAQGFEGAMVRNSDGMYVNKRSYDLQKVKEFDDAEFELVDVVPGIGKMSDKGVFVCRTEAGDKFKCKMVGELDSLKKYLDNKDDYIGKMVTVKFQGYNNKNNVPRFGVAMRIREDI